MAVPRLPFEFVEDTVEELKRLRSRQMKYNCVDKQKNGDENNSLKRSLSLPSAIIRVKTVAEMSDTFQTTHRRRTSVIKDQNITSASSSCSSHSLTSTPKSNSRKTTGLFSFIENTPDDIQKHDKKILNNIKDKDKEAYIEKHGSDKNDVIVGEEERGPMFAITTVSTEPFTNNQVMQQTESYVTWINTQLERSPSSRHVKDLSCDMRDGVVFLQLVEVISNTTQTIIDTQHMNAVDMRRNINTVLEFLSNNNVRVHHIAPKEIIDGNVKSTMRLILALAAHFKPDSLHYQGFHNTPKLTTTKSTSRIMQRAPSVVSLVSEAAASLVEASKNASKAGVSLQSKYRKVQHFEEKNSTPKPISSYSSHTSRSLRSTTPSTTPSRNNARSSITEFPSNSTDKIRTWSRSSRDSSNTVHDRGDVSSVKRALLPHDESLPDADVSKIAEMQDSLLEDLTDTKRVLSQLQNMLLSGCTPEERSGLESPKDESFQEQLVIKNIMLEHKDSEVSELRSQLNELKEINLRLSSERTGHELRMSQQEQSILSLKSKLLEIEHPKKVCTSQEELNSLLIERGKELQLLHQELVKRDEIIENQKVEIETLSQDIVGKKRIEANLHAKLEASDSMVNNLQTELREVTENMHSLSMDSKDGNHNNSNNSTPNKLQQAKTVKQKQTILREHNNMTVTLDNIRQRFSKDDPVQHAFQSMEQSMTTVINTLSLMEVTTMASCTSPNNGCVDRISQEIRPIIPQKPSLKKKSATKSTISSDSGYDHTVNTSHESPVCDQVKIVYFLGKSVTPILKTSDIGLGYFTLRDFKDVVNRPGKYRYFFKSKDLDFGYVREELLFEDDVVPGHDNKIVCWMERNMAEEV